MAFNKFYLEGKIMGTEGIGELSLTPNHLALTNMQLFSSIPILFVESANNIVEIDFYISDSVDRDYTIETNPNKLIIEMVEVKTCVELEKVIEKITFHKSKDSNFIIVMLLLNEEVRKKFKSNYLSLEEGVFSAILNETEEDVFNSGDNFDFSNWSIDSLNNTLKVYNYDFSKSENSNLEILRFLREAQKELLSRQ